MMGTYLTWGEEKKVDEIGRTVYPKTDIFDQLWPTGVHGVSKTGHPVYFERVGKMEPSKIDENFTIDEILLFHIQKMENLCRVKEKMYSDTGKRIYKHIAVLDLDGLGMKHTSKKFYGPLKQFIALDQDKYPETLYCMVILNAPWIFKALWAIASPWLDPITRQRFLFGPEALFQQVDKEELPRWLGGTCQCEGGKCLRVPFRSGKESKDRKESAPPYTAPPSTDPPSTAPISATPSTSDETATPSSPTDGVADATGAPSSTDPEGAAVIKQ